MLGVGIDPEQSPDTSSGRSRRVQKQTLGDIAAAAAAGVAEGEARELDSFSFHPAEAAAAEAIYPAVCTPYALPTVIR